AIVCEVIGTSLLQHSRQFTRLWPTVGMALFYLTSFYLLSLALRGLSLGIAYAIWSGVGIVLVALVGFLAFNQRIDLPGVIGLSMIVGGVLVVYLFAHSVGHGDGVDPVSRLVQPPAGKRGEEKIMSSQKGRVIITCAVTGSSHAPPMSEALAVTPEQIAA